MKHSVTSTAPAEVSSPPVSDNDRHCAEQAEELTETFASMKAARKLSYPSPTMEVPIAAAMLFYIGGLSSTPTDVISAMLSDLASEVRVLGAASKASPDDSALYDDDIDRAAWSISRRIELLQELCARLTISTKAAP